MADQTLFDKSLQRLKFIFFSLGLMLEPRKCNRLQIIKKRCIYTINSFWLNSDIAGAIFWFIDGAKNGKDMTELTYIAPCAILSAVSNLKTLHLINYEYLVNDLVDELRELDNIANDCSIEAKNKIEREEIRFLNFVINSLNVTNIGLVVNFSFIPLILIAVKYINTGEVELVLPFLVKYPFDPLNIKYWPYAYMKQIWSECIVLLDICAADYFYYICCTYIRIQFRLLSHGFENLVPADHFKRGNNQSDVRKKLVKLIKWHQRLISCTNTLELIYSKSTLLNFVSSSVIICLTGFNVTTLDDMVFASSFLTFLSMSLLQIFFLCLFGDMLMRASLEVSDAVYNSLWYVADRKVAKDLLLIQTRAQTPCKLTAFGFGDVNLRSFTKIISTSWSYFALLNTVYTENQV